jgi:tRNA G10  N-methylase Trm11
VTDSVEATQATFPGHLQKSATVRVVVQENNRVKVEDRAIHDWYRFVLSFPPHLVRDYLQRFGLCEGSCVLDPFCGTGTTLVECKRLGINSVGLEANPMPWFAGRVKID